MRVSILAALLPLVAGVVDLDDDVALMLSMRMLASNATNTTDGGETDGGQTDGGQTDGGETDGGETDGGKTDGGETDGGETDGGETDGGGGETDGGGGEKDGGGGETDGGETDGEGGGNLPGVTDPPAAEDREEMSGVSALACAAPSLADPMVAVYAGWSNSVSTSGYYVDARVDDPDACGSGETSEEESSGERKLNTPRKLKSFFKAKKSHKKTSHKKTSRRRLDCTSIKSIHGAGAHQDEIPGMHIFVFLAECVDSSHSFFYREFLSEGNYGDEAKISGMFCMIGGEPAFDNEDEDACDSRAMGVISEACVPELYGKQLSWSGGSMLKLLRCDKVVVVHIAVVEVKDVVSTTMTEDAADAWVTFVQGAAFRTGACAAKTETLKGVKGLKGCSATATATKGGRQRARRLQDTTVSTEIGYDLTIEAEATGDEEAADSTALTDVLAEVEAVVTSADQAPNLGDIMKETKKAVETLEAAGQTVEAIPAAIVEAETALVEAATTEVPSAEVFAASAETAKAQAVQDEGAATEPPSQDKMDSDPVDPTESGEKKKSGDDSDSSAAGAGLSAAALIAAFAFLQ